MAEMSTTEALDILGSLHKRYKAIEHGVGLMQALQTAENRTRSTERDLQKLTSNVSALETQKTKLEMAVRRVADSLRVKKKAAEEKVREIEKEESNRVAAAKAEADQGIKTQRKRLHDVREAVGAEINSLEDDAKKRAAELAQEETLTLKGIEEAKKDLAKLKAEGTRLRKKLIEGATP